MVGRDLAAVQRVPPSQEERPVVLSVRGLTRAPQYRDISFDLHRGEIVGLAGLVGAGRSETALGVFGAPPPDSGEVWLNGARIVVDRPLTAMRHGIGLVPEDRKGQGLVLMHGVGTNMTLAALRRLSNRGMIDFAAERGVVDKYVQRLRVKTPGRDQVIGLLSGGNQQKVVLAKWLATHPAVLIIDEPTRGVDVGAKAEIYALMRELAAEGACDPGDLLGPAGGADHLRPGAGDARGPHDGRAVPRRGHGGADHGARRAGEGGVTTYWGLRSA